jgi:hypothetical protein
MSQLQVKFVNRYITQIIKGKATQVAAFVFVTTVEAKWTRNVCNFEANRHFPRLLRWEAKKSFLLA